MTLAVQDLDLYNNLPQFSIFSFEKLANKILDHFGINTRKRDSITDLSKLSQFDDKSILAYVCIWRAVVMDMPYTLPQEELVKLFSRICKNIFFPSSKFKGILSLRISYSKDKIIEEVNTQEGEIKLRKKYNIQKNHNNSGNFIQPQPNP